ncbi:threonine-tRNA ligase, cytoplasmic-like isoform X4 [Arapaima gigas]
MESDSDPLRKINREGLGPRSCIGCWPSPSFIHLTCHVDRSREPGSLMVTFQGRAGDGFLSGVYKVFGCLFRCATPTPLPGSPPCGTATEQQLERSLQHFREQWAVTPGNGDFLGPKGEGSAFPLSLLERSSAVLHTMPA